MLELLQELLCFMEQHERCKECVRMMTEDELRRKQKLEMNITSLIINQLKQCCAGESAFPENENFVFEVSEINDASLESEHEHESSGKPMENDDDVALVLHPVEAAEKEVENSMDALHELISLEPMEKETETSENEPEDLEMACINCQEGCPSQINDNLLVCLFCNKTFLTKVDVEKHKCLQNVQATHKCTHCDWRYVTEVDLKTHMVVHENEKPFKCNYCDRRFTTSRHCSIHEDGHKIKEYPCDGCDLIFHSKHRLRNHSKEKHNIEVYKRGRQCVAPGCSNYQYTKPKRSFHVFPRRYPKVFNQWVETIQKLNPDFQPPDSSCRPQYNACLVCSDHFTKDCYENKTSVNELCNFKMKNSLKISAIPTIFNV